MKRKAIVCLLFVVALVISLSPGAAAISIDLSDVTVSADAQGLQVRADGQDPASHFARQSSLMPGDTVRRALVITNSLPDACTVFLRTQDLRSSPADFVNKIEMKLSLDGTVVYDGELSSGLDALGNPLENRIEIGRIEPGREYRLQA